MGGLAVNSYCCVCGHQISSNPASSIDSRLNDVRFRICRGRVLAWEVDRGGREDDVVVPAVWADAGGWLQLLHGGRAEDGGSCSRHSRQEMLSGFRVLLSLLAVSF